ncbi:zinc finger protein 2-like [Cynara cardunculus var. scolymus]|uniref:Zinc finger, C2H2 n=1 Tax=Cynara cardunculus var. scolymus TaxID=59895 RepID=A0A103Y2M2_CYNCS|nr:zinc finger protein 2-like [Cynara cardunculus var. scolymus]KVI01400.1 Zinc finger, C2H2 [Cynara cardunculus var. scolymus]
MSFLNLHQPENELDIEIFRDPNLPSSSLLSSLHNNDQRVFSCSYCRRKFYSPQAFGGHQNAHKLERTLAKKSREMSLSAARYHSEWNQMPSRFGSNGSSHVEPVQPPTVVGIEGLQLFGSGETRREMGYGYKGDQRVDDGFNQLDLSLRL